MRARVHSTRSRGLSCGPAGTTLCETQARHRRSLQPSTCGAALESVKKQAGLYGRADEPLRDRDRVDHGADPRPHRRRSPSAATTRTAAACRRSVRAEARSRGAFRSTSPGCTGATFRVVAVPRRAPQILLPIGSGPTRSTERLGAGSARSGAVALPGVTLTSSARTTPTQTAVAPSTSTSRSAWV